MSLTHTTQSSPARVQFVSLLVRPTTSRRLRLSSLSPPTRRELCRRQGYSDEDGTMACSPWSNHRAVLLRRQRFALECAPLYRDQCRVPLSVPFLLGAFSPTREYSKGIPQGTDGSVPWSLKERRELGRTNLTGCQTRPEKEMGSTASQLSFAWAWPTERVTALRGCNCGGRSPSSTVDTTSSPPTLKLKMEEAGGDHHSPGPTTPAPINTAYRDVVPD
jgi:hypothetical protein